MSLLNNGDIIACDGAVTALEAHGYAPTAIVGDLDSLSANMRKRYAKIIHHVGDQETNDLTKAANFAAELGYTDVTILGATGKREDHELGNIGLLMDFASVFRKVRMVSDFGTFTPLLRGATVASRPGQQVSIFSFNPQAPITTGGLKWELVNRCLEKLWRGTLNEAIGHSFSIDFPAGTPVMVYQANELKLPMPHSQEEDQDFHGCGYGESNSEQLGLDSCGD